MSFTLQPLPKSVTQFKKLQIKQPALPPKSTQAFFKKTTMNANIYTWEWQCSIFHLHKTVQLRLQVCTQGYKSIELFFRVYSYYRF